MRRPLLHLMELQQHQTSGLEHAATVDSGNPMQELALHSHPHWYLVQCRARQDERALEHLERQGEYPLPVADGIIEQLRQRIEMGWPRETYLQSGERVIVTEGSFAGIEAIFQSDDGDRRVILLLNILHSEQRLSFPIGSVRKI